MENETSTKVKPIIEKGFGQGFQEKIGDVLFQNNKTNMTEKERDMIRCWIDQGALIK